MGLPWRLAFALQADGWWLRSDCIWAKPNGLPESVTDRPTKAHEYVFLLAKRERYWFDQEAVREPHAPGSLEHHLRYPNDRYASGGKWGDNGKSGNVEGACNPAGRNIRTVWETPEPLFTLRADLSAADRAYVLAELAKRGL